MDKLNHVTCGSGSRRSSRYSRKSLWTLKTLRLWTCFCSIYHGFVTESPKSPTIIIATWARLELRLRAHCHVMRIVLNWVVSCNLDWARVWCTAYNLDLFMRNFVLQCFHSTSTMFIALLTIYFLILEFFRKCFNLHLFTIFVFLDVTNLCVSEIGSRRIFLAPAQLPFKTFLIHAESNFSNSP